MRLSSPASIRSHSSSLLAFAGNAGCEKQTHRASLRTERQGRWWAIAAPAATVRPSTTQALEWPEPESASCRPGEKTTDTGPYCTSRTVRPTMDCADGENARPRPAPTNGARPASPAPSPPRWAIFFLLPQNVHLPRPSSRLPSGGFPRPPAVCRPGMGCKNRQVALAETLSSAPLRGRSRLSIA